jgi:glucan biosynthesis protein C
MAPSPTPERLHGLDALRGFALLLGVVLHGSMSFLPGPSIWIASDVSRSSTLSLAFFVIHMLRMTTFFLLAGFMARLSFHRLGVWGFAKDRLKRIALPLITAWPLIFIALLAIAAWATFTATGTVEPPPPSPSLSVRSFPLAHLWFLYLLLLLYPTALVLRAIIAFFDRWLPLRRWADAALRGLLRPWAALLLALPLAIALYLHPYWFGWFGIPTPDQSLIPNLPALVGYGLAFSLGWLLHRQPPLLKRLEAQWPWLLALALAATLCCLNLAGLHPVLMPLPQGSGKLFYAAGYAVAVWAWAFALLGLSFRFFSRPSPTRRYLADASYWIYLAHLPIVMVFQVAIAKVPLHWALKFPLFLTLALGLLFLSYHLFVRFTFIGAVLNGHRKKRDTEALRAPLPKPLG